MKPSSLSLSIVEAIWGISLGSEFAAGFALASAPRPIATEENNIYSYNNISKESKSIK
jgi:hypothetical protein